MTKFSARSNASFPSLPRKTLETVFLTPNAYCPFISASIRLDEKQQYRLDLQQIKRDIMTQGLEVIIASNPRNPTGQVIQGQDLKDLVDTCRDASATLVMDEVRLLASSPTEWFLSFVRSSTRGTSTPRKRRTSASLCHPQNTSTTLTMMLSSLWTASRR